MAAWHIATKGLQKRLLSVTWKRAIHLGGCFDLLYNGEPFEIRVPPSVGKSIRAGSVGILLKKGKRMKLIVRISVVIRACGCGSTSPHTVLINSTDAELGHFLDPFYWEGYKKTCIPPYMVANIITKSLINDWDIHYIYYPLIAKRAGYVSKRSFPSHINISSGRIRNIHMRRFLFPSHDRYNPSPGPVNIWFQDINELQDTKTFYREKVRLDLNQNAPGFVHLMNDCADEGLGPDWCTGTVQEEEVRFYCSYNFCYVQPISSLYFIVKKKSKVLDA